MSGVEGVTTELAADLSEVARTLFAAGGVEETLQAIVDLAVTTIDGCDVAGIFLTRGDQIATSVYTDGLAVEVDDLQLESGEGPCLDAVGLRTSFYAEDLIGDDRWVTFGPKAVGIGVRCTLALNLSTDESPGALNLYARYPRAFGATDRAKAVIFGTLASLALRQAHVHEDEDRRAEHLHAALSTRELIGQAQGILMEREHITSSQAFDILRRASQHLNIRLRDIAQDLIDTGQRPGHRPDGPQPGRHDPPV
ncbi:MAG: ANTAR domain-containing protein [Acidimicrobiales bacterium]